MLLGCITRQLVILVLRRKSDIQTRDLDAVHRAVEGTSEHVVHVRAVGVGLAGNPEQQQQRCIHDSNHKHEEELHRLLVVLVYGAEREHLRKPDDEQCSKGGIDDYIAHEMKHPETGEATNTFKWTGFVL